jgi:phosphoglycerate kinase
MQEIMGLDDLEVEGKRVFCRLDFNVPLDAQRKVADATRIKAALPTLNNLLERGARVIAASHLGRPKGEIVEALRIEPVGAKLAELLDREIKCADSVVGDGVQKLVADMRDGELVLLENLRFHPGEKKNDPDFCKQLAALCDVYVNDAFGTAHRAHASTTGLAQLKEKKGAGFLLRKELEFFGKLLKAPEKPFVALLGGVKVSDKIGVLKSLLQRVDVLLIGGAMANTFLAARGQDMGGSKVEQDKLSLAREILSGAEARGIEVALPTDVVVAPALDSERGEVVSVGEVAPDQMALDIGPQTRRGFGDVLARAKTIFWNGPMGVFETKAFAAGTVEVAQKVAAAAALSVVGGGDSVAAIHQAGVAERISHISTGGGASLEMMEGKDLPGVAALRA